MPRLPLRVVMFVSSYAPLLGLLAWRTRAEPAAWIALGAAAIVSVGVLAALLRTRREQEFQLHVERWQPKDAEALGYIATYLIPLLAFDPGDADDVVALAVFALVLAVVYCNSSLIYTNPMLNMLGYRIYEVGQEGDPLGYTLVTRKKTLLDHKRPIPAERVGDTLIFIDTERGKQ